MKIVILKNCFRPDGSSAPTIFKRDSLQDIPDDQAKILIEKKVAVEVKDPKAEKKEEKKDDKSETSLFKPIPLKQMVALLVTG